MQHLFKITNNKTNDTHSDENIHAIVTFMRFTGKPTPIELGQARLFMWNKEHKVGDKITINEFTIEVEQWENS